VTGQRPTPSALTDAAVAPAVACVGLVKRFGEIHAVDGLDLTVPRGQITALLGPSGCGKTTALRMIAGFVAPDAGRIDLDGETVATEHHGVPPEKRRVGMVFQDYALFPHLTVLDNVAYGLRHLPRPVRRGLAEQALTTVDLRGVAHRLPSSLSGGQQQRVALARALAPSPRVILLDEPFSNLDAALRVQVREEVREILKAAATTAVFVTHDQEEALSLADEVAVMAAGRIHQIASPRELYERPATAFVARFVGDADVLPGRRIDDRVVRTALGDIRTQDRVHSDRCEVVLRPEVVRLQPAADGETVVTAVTYFGHDQLVHLELPDGTAVRSRQGPDLHVRAGDRVRVTIEAPLVAFPASPTQVEATPALTA